MCTVVGVFVRTTHDSLSFLYVQFTPLLVVKLQTYLELAL